MVHDSFSLVNVEDNTTNFYIPNNTLGFLQPHRFRESLSTAIGASADTILLGCSWNVVAETGFSCQKIEAVDVAPGFTSSYRRGCCG